MLQRWPPPLRANASNTNCDVTPCDFGFDDPLRSEMTDQAPDRAHEFWIAVVPTKIAHRASSHPLSGQRVEDIGPKRFKVITTATRALVTEVIV